MSLNEKYIINGSTLSDIGDALRARGIITPPTAIEAAQVLTYSQSYSVSYGYDGKITVQASDFAFTGKTPTAVKIYYSGSSAGNNKPYVNNGAPKLTKSWDTAIKVNLPVTVTIPNSYGYTYYGTVYFVPVVANGLGYDYIVQDSSITLPSNSYFWNSLEGAGRTIPNRIQVSDIASTILASGNKQYQIYTADSSVTTGDNIHYIAWSNTGYGGFTMPENIDYSKMVFCLMNYSDSYNFTYVRDVMPYIANSDKTQIFFPCFYYQMGGFPSGSNVIKTRTLRNSSNPYVANGWYGLGYKATDPTMLTIGGVKLTAVTENSITLKYQGGLGSRRNSDRSMAIFEK